MESNLKELIQSCIEGNRKSQQALYKTFYGKMMAICIRYVVNPDDAKEVLNSAFLKVFKNLENYKGEGAFEGWIRKTVVNTAIDHIRKQKDFEVPLSENDYLNLIDNNENEEYIGSVKLSEEEILKNVQELSPAYRTAFNLFVVEDFSHKEISEKLGISVGASKSNLAKAKKKLKEQLMKIMMMVL